MGNKKIPYNKKLSGKQWGGGGPRDMQKKQNSLSGDAVIKLPQLNEEELKKLLAIHESKTEEGAIDEKDQFLPLDEVKKKIDEAVEFTIAQERNRHKGEITNLNTELDHTKKRLWLIDKTLEEKDNELKILKTQNVDIENNKEITSKIDEKEKVINKLLEDHALNMSVFIKKLNEIDNKLSKSGLSLSKDDDKGRPEIQDRVFIDPLEKTPSDLDSHIEIEEDASESVDIKDVRVDLDKVRRLLGKK